MAQHPPGSVNREEPQRLSFTFFNAWLVDSPLRKPNWAAEIGTLSSSSHTFSILLRISLSNSLSVESIIPNGLNDEGSAAVA